MDYKKITLFYTGLLTVFSFFYSQAQDARNIMNDSLQLYNKLLTVQEMHDDIKLMFHIHREANSGFYAYRTEQQVDSMYRAAALEIQAPMRVADFYKVILRLVDDEGSVHNYTIPDLSLIDFLNRQQAFFPYPLIYLEGKIVFDGRSAPIPPGSQITAINGVSDEQLMHAFYKYYPSDGYNRTRKLSASVDKAFGINYLLEYGLFDEYTVTYRRPGTDAEEEAVMPAVTLAERDTNITNRYSAPVTGQLDFKTQQPYSFRMLQPSVGLLNLRWFGMVTGQEDPGFETYVHFLDSVFTVLDNNGVTNLIIDVRNNPGGADPTFEEPVMHLTDQTFKENVDAYIAFDPDSIPYMDYFWGVSTSERLDSLSIEAGKAYLKDHFPVYRNGISKQNQKYNPTYHPKTPAFRGHLYLLINENVGSAASHFVSLVKGYVENVTMVGVETCGGYYVHNGHTPLVYELPHSRIKTQFSIVHVTQDAPEKESQPEGHGIIPDYEVWPSLEDFFRHKDTQLEFVLKLIEERGD